MSIRLYAFLVPLLAALCAGPGAGFAQSSDLRPLLDRLERMERDLNLLQRQVYSGKAPAQAGAGGQATFRGDGVDPQIMAVLEDRFSQVREQLREITDQVERANFKTQLFEDKLERLTKDIDFRFKEFDAKQAAVATQGGMPLPADAAAQSPGNAGGAQLPPTMGAPPGVLGQLPQSALKPPVAQPAQPVKLSPKDEYDRAYQLLMAGDFPAAEQAFAGFVTANPEHELAGNAQYWLGETFYKRSNLQQAAVAFLQGYQKYPKSSKAPDNLLKLGMTLAGLGQKKEACAALGKLAKEFPKAPDHIKRYADAEKQKAGCN